MSRWTRRSVLRGAVGGLPVALALPTLEAHAEEAASEPIFGLYFWANGLPWHAGHGGALASDTHPDLYTPATEGPGFEPSPLLSLLGAHPYSVVTGLQPHTEIPALPGGQGDGHMRGFMVAMTGDRPREDDFDHGSHALTAKRATLDQLVARETDFYAEGAVPRYRSLEVGVSTRRFHDYGHWNAISYTGPGALNPAICTPSVLYDRLFGVDLGSASMERRAGLLDAVLEDAAALRGRLGAADALRIDAHMEHLYEVQRRLQTGAVACAVPAPPEDSTDLLTRADAISELLAVALSCGLTRVFSYMLTSPASTHAFTEVGVSTDMHTVCHDGRWEDVLAITEIQLEALGRFMDRLSTTLDPTGTSLLDRMLLYCTSEYGEGHRHNVTETPVILAGRAGGHLQTGVHVRDPGGNLSVAQLTALQMLGLPFDQFGWNGGETSDTFTELMR